MSGPSIDRANSSGDIWTPQDFRVAVIKKFGMPTFDLACSQQNMFGYAGYTEEKNSLTKQWWPICGPSGGVLWLNPPFSNITPWVRKCVEESYRPDIPLVRAAAEILLLVPGSIGANWYWQWVEPYADVYSIGRLKFDNCFDRKTGLPVKTAYPKDLILCHYYNRQSYKEMQRWRWQNDCREDN